MTEKSKSSDAHYTLVKERHDARGSSTTHLGSPTMQELEAT